MPLEEIFKHKNINGEPYLCDIAEWLGYPVWNTLTYKQHQEFVQKIKVLIND
jgi:hypothetical protein